MEQNSKGSILELKNVCVEFNTVSGNKMRALNNISLKTNDNELVAIVGRSGCGKSTLLNVVAGLLKPTSGTAKLNNKKIEGPGRDRGVVFQADAVFAWKRVYQNLEFALKLANVPKEERGEKIDQYLDMVFLRKFKNFYPKELSGGMKKRLQIAMVLANGPKMLLMDEPFGALDYATKIDMQMELESIRMKEPLGTLFVTHDVEEAVFLADRVIMMDKGEIIDEAHVDFKRPRTLELRQSKEFMELTRHFLDKLLESEMDKGGENEDEKE